MNQREPIQREPDGGLPEATPIQWLLTQRDATVLDELIEHSFDSRAAARGIGAGETSRMAHLGALLGLLEEPTALADASLLDATMARILTSAAAAQAPEYDSDELIPADVQLADAMVQGGWASSPGREDARVLRHVAIGELLASGPPLSNSALVDRTMARVSAAPRLRFRPAEEPRGVSSGWRLRDLVSVAAMLVLGASIVLPLLSSLRTESMRTACIANLGAVAQGLSRYALTNTSPLPMATAGFFDGSWWDVGVPRRSNSANLFALVSGRYVRLDELACPGNPFAARGEPSATATDWKRLEEVSYSYQIAPPVAPANWPTPDSVVLADRSPVVLAAVRKRWADPTENSPNHGRRGQHLLRADGAVTWLETPVLANGDNIWLPRAIERRIDEIRRNQGLTPLNGVETPADVDDVLLGP